MRMFLLLSYIFCWATFGFLGMAWMLDGDTDLATQYLFIFAVMTVLGFIYFKARKSNNDSSQKWISEQVKKYNIKNRKFVLSGNVDNGNLIYDKNRLIFMNPYKKDVSIININDVLDIKIEVVENVKNVKRVIALTSTYDKISKIDCVKMIIIASSNTYSIICDNGDLINKLNDIERYKLILEKDMRKLNNSNI